MNILMYHMCKKKKTAPTTLRAEHSAMHFNERSYGSVLLPRQNKNIQTYHVITKYYLSRYNVITYIVITLNVSRSNNIGWSRAQVGTWPFAMNWHHYGNTGITVAQNTETPLLRFLRNA